MDTEKLTSLIISAQNGDKSSIIKLFHNYNPFINNFLKTINTTSYEINDLKQECYLTLVSCLKSYNFNSPFTAYYTKSVKNNIYNLVRNNRPLLFDLTRYDFIADKREIDDLIIQKITINKLKSALESLNNEERQIILDYYFNDLSLIDIAIKNNLKYITLVKKKDRLIKNLKNNLTGI